MRTQEREDVLNVSTKFTCADDSLFEPMMLNIEGEDALSEYITGDTLMHRLQPRIKAMFE